MGFYLNCAGPLALYRAETNNPYFVDKTAILTELIPLVEQQNKCVCITRPRRFGKSVMATMIGSFFGCGADGSECFDKLQIASHPGYRKHLNTHQLLYIDWSKVDAGHKRYADYIREITDNLVYDLMEAFPQVDFRTGRTVSHCLHLIFEQTQTKFLFVFDEWDYIFHKDYITDDDRRQYNDFLSSITKGTPYVEFVYMTGILPIAKYSSGSSLNHFEEYTMVTQTLFGKYFGFTEEEVDALYDKYLAAVPSASFTRADLRYWYDGYSTLDGIRIYNPRSVVRALTTNRLANYWTKSGPYAEVSTYIVQDTIPELSAQLARMVAGEAVPVEMDEKVAAVRAYTTVDEVLSAMVVYGFLNYTTDVYGQGFVSIPNKELMDEFAKTIRTKKDLGSLHLLAKASREMLEATWQGDTEKMAAILAHAHNTESPILHYNNEAELSAIVSLVYLSARDIYDIRREEKGGRGFVDFLFLPRQNKGDDCIILELKVNDTPENALAQIRRKQYVLRLQGKWGEMQEYTGRILAYGITYDKETGVHQCKGIVLREALETV